MRPIQSGDAVWRSRAGGKPPTLWGSPLPTTVQVREESGGGSVELLADVPWWTQERLTEWSAWRHEARERLWSILAPDSELKASAFASVKLARWRREHVGARFDLIAFRQDYRPLKDGDRDEADRQLAAAQRTRDHLIAELGLPRDATRTEQVAAVILRTDLLRRLSQAGLIASAEHLIPPAPVSRPRDSRMQSAPSDAEDVLA